MRVLGFINNSLNELHKHKGKFKVHPLGFNQFRSRGISSLDYKYFHEDDKVLPVLIVGAGPVGLVLSILLTKLGVKCAVLEKATSFSKHPQAHFINNRTMEVFRKIDGLAEEIQRSQPPVDLWRKFIYCTSLSGSILGSVDHMQPQDFEKVVSPVSVAHFSQYKLTTLLLKQLEDLSFPVCTSEALEGLNHRPLKGREILMGHECVSIDNSGRYVDVTAAFLEEGKYMEKNIQCNILVGTDGAGSTVRKLVGIDLRAIGVLVAHDLKQGEFVLQIPFYPPQQNLEDFSPEVCKNLIFKLAGRELSDIDVIDIKPWVMHAEVAEKFVCNDNRVILAGDAAHRFPPAGGFGMNTGIQDAHNLAWKIASFVKHIAPASILETYETERKPIAVFNTALSVQNFRAAMSVPAALGLDPTVANSVHQVINSRVGSVLSSGLQREILDGVFRIGRAQLSEYLLDERNPLGYLKRAKLRHIFEEGKSLQLQFPAEDLGFRYLKGALLPDSETAPGAPELPNGRRRDFVPSADPGSRLPHMNVRVLSNLSSEEICSTLDLVSGDKIEFLLIIAPVDESYHLAYDAFKMAEKFNVSAKVCVLWPASTKGIEEGSKVALTPWENFVDVVEVKRSPTSPSWWDICQMTDKGAILVRPDEHIAWCAKSRVVYPILEMEKEPVLPASSLHKGAAELLQSGCAGLIDLFFIDYP
uniref:FAD-binding domain-containing protein n=1 Tax=Fagus sylvatica TaxID=28930 RepID=A0A2N9FSR5_FAGSY